MADMLDSTQPSAPVLALLSFTSSLPATFYQVNRHDNVFFSTRHQSNTGHIIL